MAQVVVIGAGGIGNWLLRGLAPMLDYGAPDSLLYIVDGDRFEEKNRERQDFTEMGDKATVRANTLQPMYPRTIIAAKVAWVIEALPEGAENHEDGVGFVAVDDVVPEGALVIVAVDNHATRKLVVEAAARRKNVDVLLGGNDEAFYGSVYHYRRRDGADVTDDPREYHPELADPPDRNPAELSCEERTKLPSGTQLVATNMGVAAFLLARAHRILFEDDPGTAASEIFLDLGLGQAAPYDREAT